MATWAAVMVSPVVALMSTRHEPVGSVVRTPTRQASTSSSPDCTHTSSGSSTSVGVPWTALPALSLAWSAGTSSAASALGWASTRALLAPAISPPSRTWTVTSASWTTCPSYSWAKVTCVTLGDWVRPLNTSDSKVASGTAAASSSQAWA